MYDVILLLPAAVAADERKASARQQVAKLAHVAIPTDDERIS